MKLNNNFVYNVHDNQPGGFCLIDWYEGIPHAEAFTDTFPKMTHEVSEYIKDTDGECDLMIVKVICKLNMDEGLWRRSIPA